MTTVERTPEFQVLWFDPTKGHQNKMFVSAVAALGYVNMLERREEWGEVSGIVIHARLAAIPATPWLPYVEVDE